MAFQSSGIAPRHRKGLVTAAKNVENGKQQALEQVQQNLATILARGLRRISQWRVTQLAMTATDQIRPIATTTAIPTINAGICIPLCRIEFAEERLAYFFAVPM
jgi:hypothetical protein